MSRTKAKYQLSVGETHPSYTDILCYFYSCIKTKQSPSCLQSSYETTTPRWMQKDGFPAAAILALFILAVALLVIAVKLIYRQLDILERRRNGSIDNSVLSNHDRSQSSNPTQIVVKIDQYTEENELSILFLKKASKV
jgi:hypothetical protein